MGEELELLATSAYMLGDENEWMQILERAFHKRSEDGEMLRAARYVSGASALCRPHHAVG
jgi:hypothetical protein